MADPHRLRFSTTHEWADIQDESGQRVATIGISAFALAQLTDLVHVELPPVGQSVAPGKPLGEIESVKAVSDVYSPVEGQVIAVNTDLAGNLEHMGDDPYGKSWIVKVRLASEAGLDKLLDYDAYQAQCASEG